MTPVLVARGKNIKNVAEQDRSSFNHRQRQRPEREAGGKAYLGQGADTADICGLEEKVVEKVYDTV